MMSALEKKDPHRRQQTVARFLFGTVALALFVLVPTSFLSRSYVAAQEPKAAQTNNPGGQATLKTTVRQVLLDVVVTDRKNHPVSGLRQEDFSILEDGVPQNIIFFEPHTAFSDASAPKLSEAPALPPNTFVNTSSATDKLPLNVLLYDLLNTPLTDQPFARQEIVKFLRNRPAGSRFAIFVLADTLHLVQGFTDDERQLVAAMQRKEANPRSTLFYQSSAGLQGTSAQFAGNPALGNDGTAQAMLGRLQNMEQLTRRFYLSRRVEQTLAAFEEIARFLSGLPGRKNLIWLSGSFPANIFPGQPCRAQGQVVAVISSGAMGDAHPAAGHKNQTAPAIC